MLKPRSQRLLDAHDTIGAKAKCVDDQDNAADTVDAFAEKPSCHTGQEQRLQIPRVEGHRRRSLLEEDAIADQTAADAGDEGQGEQADEVVPALEGHAVAGKAVDERRGKVEEQWDLKGFRRHRYSPGRRGGRIESRSPVIVAKTWTGG